MRFFQNGIQDQWHFVIGKGGSDAEAFYQELERQLAPQIQSLNLASGYTTIGSILNRRQAHYVKFGPYKSLTCANPFGADLSVSWYLYYTWAGASAEGTGWMLLLSDLMGLFTGKSQDRVIAFATIGKDSAERATKAILSSREEAAKEPSGQLGGA